MAIPRIPERFLRHIWQHQQFSPSPLFTSDGDRVVVRSPGLINRDGGPDFTGAVLRIGHVLYRGDVELHVRASSWRAHGHCADPHYNRVILHVVLLPGGAWPPPRTSSGRTVPLLVLSPFVDPLLYNRWMNEFRNESPLPALCRGMNRVVTLPVLTQRILALGRRRIESRVRSLGKRLRWLIEESERGAEEPRTRTESLHTGPWEQLLYECLLEGMGYAKNRAPFLALARSVPLLLLKAHDLSDARAMLALLFGAAGLLPAMRTVRESESRAYARTLGRRWRELRPSLKVPLLHEGDWMFFRLRPVNFPTARLAAFCFLLPSFFAGHPLDRILAILRSTGATPRARRSALVSMFRVSPEGFWSQHCHFRGTRRCCGIALGHDRAQELIVNGIVPLLLLHARVYPESAVRRRSLSMLCAPTAAGENGVTRLVRDALIGSREGKTPLRSPLERHGMLHLYKTYCSRGRCSRCPVRTGPRRRKAGTAMEAASVVRMSRRRLRGRMSKCLRR